MSEQRLFKVEGEGHIGLRWTVSANPEASAREGRPVFDQVLHGEVLAPGQGKSTPSMILLRKSADGKVRKYDPNYTRYQAQVEQFLASDESSDLQGTPIDQWPMVDAPFAATLKALKIFTVEQLAELTDTAKQHLGMGADTWVKKAQNWLAAAKDGAAVSRMTAELAERDAVIADLKRQMAELAARVDEAAPKGKRAA